MTNSFLGACTLLSFAFPVAAVAQTAPARAAEIGQPAPAFTLKDLEGTPHALADVKGRVVVLEWTNYVCPAVAGWHESRCVADAQAALDPAQTAWWRIDSSWFAPAMKRDIAAWQERLGLAGPILLDTDGAVARSYGAEATPQFFVIDASGVLRYVGALGDYDRAEDERVDHVVEAVQALLGGREVERPKTRASGCTLKFDGPREAVAPREIPEMIDENARAQALYAEAVNLARSGKHAVALEKLEQAFAAELPRPWRAVADPAFRSLLADFEARRKLRALLDKQPARGELVMVAPDEKGTPFVLAGTVSNEDGEPIAGAVIALYHTDDAGWYSAGSVEGNNPRLFGRVTSDANGRWRVRTIVPGHYNGVGGPMHVHMSIRAEGYRAKTGHPASVFFADDPELVGEAKQEIKGDGCAILPRTKNAEGVALIVHDVTLDAD